MIAYCISGLGADERVFNELRLDCEIVPIHWLTPSPDESLQAYSQRLIAQIDTSKDFLLIGVSFGGMIACEMNQFIQPKQTIIISSAAQAGELPMMYKFMGKIKLAHWLPEFMLFPPLFALTYLFDVETPEHKILIKNISRDTDPVFARWAIDKITHWKNKIIPAHLVRIHGDRDKVLPHCAADAHIITDGGHFMIVDRADEISAIINHLMKTLR